MYMRFKDGKVKTVTLSYDDGVVYDKRLMDIMAKYGLKGTFNINSGGYRKADTGRRMALKEAQELYINSQNEVTVHTLTHPFLTSLDDCEVIREITEDRRNIERDFNTIARGMAYPYGVYDERVKDILRKCGICYSRTVKSTEKFALPNDWLELHPTCHHNNPRLIQLAEEFVNKVSWGPCMMFYLWGHSYEFEDNDNWEVIEEFTKFIGNRDDIWYATNIEIYDYVKAYEALRTDFDKRIIHNPSAIDVWVYADGETLCIGAGETVHRK